MTFHGDSDVGAIIDPGCKSTVARWPAGRALVHAGDASLVARTNVSIAFSFDGGYSWPEQHRTMLWAAPLVAGYATVQPLQPEGRVVAAIFENATCGATTVGGNATGFGGNIALAMFEPPVAPK
jgi:hypothetical protein